METNILRLGPVFLAITRCAKPRPFPRQRAAVCRLATVRAAASAKGSATPLQAQDAALEPVAFPFRPFISMAAQTLDLTSPPRDTAFAALVAPRDPISFMLQTSSHHSGHSIPRIGARLPSRADPNATLGSGFIAV